MNSKISNGLTPLTEGSILAGILAVQLSVSPMGPPRPVKSDPIKIATDNASTFGNVWNSTSRATKIADEMPLANLYSELLANQEPLGRDIERIIAENIWDLYER